MTKMYKKKEKEKQRCFHVHSKKMLGCFNPNLGQIWTNPNVGLKMQ